MNPRELEKRRAAERSLDFVVNGMTLGLGSGSTSEVMVELLGQRVQQGLQVRGAVPTSKATRAIAERYGIPITTLDETPHLDLTIDGADECDRELSLIKGGGGALLHEKIVAAASTQVVIIVDAGKLVEHLGAFRLPVEVVPFALGPVSRRLAALGGRPVRRERDGAPFVTQESNYILDCDFGAITDAAHLAARLSTIPGVVEHGLFVNLADVVVVGRGETTELLVKQRASGEAGHA